MTEPEATDADLVRATLDGDSRGFEALVERHQGRLFALVGHYTRVQVEVEDIVQEAFLKAFAKLETFQLQATFSTWLHRLTINHCRQPQAHSGQSLPVAQEMVDRLHTECDGWKNSSV